MKGLPLDVPMQDQNGNISIAWKEWFIEAQSVLRAEQRASATRPTTGLYPGMPHFDPSLGSDGQKIFVNKDTDGWVDGDGNAV
jgi:hypothetical protein